MHLKKSKRLWVRGVSSGGGGAVRMWGGVGGEGRSQMTDPVRHIELYSFKSLNSMTVPFY